MFCAFIIIRESLWWRVCERADNIVIQERKKWLGGGNGYLLHSSKSILNLTCLSALFTSCIPSNDLFASPKVIVNLNVFDRGIIYLQYVIVFLMTADFYSLLTLMAGKGQSPRNLPWTNPTEFVVLVGLD